MLWEASSSWYKLEIQDHVADLDSDELKPVGEASGPKLEKHASKSLLMVKRTKLSARLWVDSVELPLTIYMDELLCRPA